MNKDLFSALVYFFFSFFMHLSKYFSLFWGSVSEMLWYEKTGKQAWKIKFCDWNRRFTTKKGQKCIEFTYKSKILHNLACFQG